MAAPELVYPETTPYSVFGSALYRINQVKWLFPQEKSTFLAVPTLTSETKTL
jgi:hypothetical protein